MKKLFKVMLPLLLTVAGTVHATEKCSLSPRTVPYKGEPIDISVNKNGWTRLVFPEEYLVGVDPEVKTGIEVMDLDSELSNRKVVRTLADNYNSLVFVYGGSGKEYVLNLRTDDCSDSQVKLENFEPSDETLAAKERLDERNFKTLNSYMYKYIQSGRTMPLPKGFRQEVIDPKKNDALVMEVGSVKFFMEEIWRGPNKTGLFVRVENHGREATKLGISQIDFDDPDIIREFGLVDKIAMIPISHILAPAPQYTSDLYDNQPSVGYLFIASE